MCGICGIFNYAGTSFEITEDLIIEMRDTMIHRGPDDAGVYVSNDRRLGLGFRRLSIIDLSPAGHQPMCNEDGTIWITLNGEIYNYQELREELKGRGHRFKSRTDTEVVIHLYEEHGKDLVHKLRGMFAFAVWDNRKRQLLLARDRMGIKPLYYTLHPSTVSGATSGHSDGQLIFASEIKAILKHPSISREIDKEAFYHYLTFVTTPAPMTMFQGINKLPPGYLMTVDDKGHVKQEQYWDVSESMAALPGSRGNPLRLPSEEYYAERIRELLRDSIKARMMSHVPFGVFLSGGVDSSTNVALMSELMDRPVETFSVGFKHESEANEFQYARKVATLFNTNHHEVIIDDRDFLEFFQRLAYYQDEPLADPVCVPLYYVSKLARDNGVIVMQVGEGSDELFSGYEGYLQTLRRHNAYWKYFKYIPRGLKAIGYRLGGNLVSVIKRDHLRRAVFDGELFWGGAIAYWELEKNMLLSRELKRQLGELDSYKIIKNIYEKLQGKDVDYLRRMIYLELKQRLPELLLMRVDKITMANSVESRVPFLDHRLVEFAMNIPTQFKVRNGEGKYILKKTVEGILPEEIVYRKKVGFGGSARNMLTPTLKSYTWDLLFSTPAMKEYFDMDYVKEMFENTESDYSSRIWNLLNFGLWYKEWLM